MEATMNDHTRSITLAFFFLVTGIVVGGVVAGDETAGMRQVEDFSTFNAGTFPEGWKARGGDGSKVYRVKANHESYLEAKAIRSAVTIAKEFQYDLKDYPFLSWQWRVLELPRGGDERYKKTGDSAAAIYVIFPGLLRPDNLKYVWSPTLPIATTTESPYSSKTKIVVLRNQSSPLGTWVSEKVNVYEDYKRLFGRDPEHVQAIGLMSDSDNTESRAEAHYKWISITKK
jgi:hypothetical protein